MKKLVLAMMMMILLAGNSLVINAAGEPDIPAFLMIITNGDETVVTNAFYMRDGRSNGNTYLMASGVIGAFADGSYEMYVMRDEYQAQVTDIYFDASKAFAFLSVEGMEQFEPIELATDTSNVHAALAWMTLDDNQNFQVNMEEIDLNSWRYEQGAYTGNGELADTLFLGAPAIDLNTMNVWGMMYATTDFEPMIIDINFVDIPAEAAIIEGNVQETAAENNPEDSGNKANSGMPTGIVIIVIVAIAAVVKNKNKEKKNEVVQPAAEHPAAEHTVIKQDTIEETIMDQTIVISREFPEEKHFQIRGMDGYFKGQIFEVKDLMKMGRSSACQIQYGKDTAGISRIHCQIEANQEGIILRDLNSTCGTYGCGEKLQAQEDYLLRAGESFWLGDEKQMFTVEEKENGYEK